MWRDGTKSVLPGLAGREPSGDDTSVAAINAQGRIVGSARTTEPSRYEFHAVVWENGQIRDLGTLGPGGSHAHGINDLGQVVGSSDLGPGAPTAPTYRAFLHSDGQMIDLNTRIDPASGWVLNAALGINRQGQIVGVGTQNGQHRTFLLTPAP